MLTVLTRRLLCLMPVLAAFHASGCASPSPWKRTEVLFNSGGIVLYREHKEEEGQRVALGYAHPVNLTLEKAVLILSHLGYRRDTLLTSKETPIFSNKEVAALAEALSIALGAVTPDERLRLLVLHSDWKEVLIGVRGTSGVLFSTREGFINLAFDRIGERISIPDGGEPLKIRFPDEPTDLTDVSPLLPGEGFRFHAGAAGASYPRWIEIDVAAVKSVAAPPPQVARPNTPATEGSPRPGTAAVEPPRTPETPPPSQEARYEKLRARIETLNRLRKDGVITEEQYQEEYKKVISDL